MRRIIVLALLLIVINVGLSAVLAQDTHIVQRKENLTRIAEKYGRTVMEIASANRLSAPYIIHAGNRIVIPAPPGPMPAEPPPPAIPMPASVDNCCFVNQQCSTDRDWLDGFYAFQRGMCPASAPALPHSPALPSLTRPANVDNCCNVNRDCQTESDWVDGFYAFQFGSCPTGPNLFGADLAIDGVPKQQPHPAVCGETYTLSVRIRNIGSRRAKGGLVQIVDSRRDGAGREVTYTVFGQLDPGQVATSSARLTATTHHGELHHVNIYVDHDNRVAEINEDNNHAAGVAYVLARGDC